MQIFVALYEQLDLNHLERVFAVVFTRFKLKYIHFFYFAFLK